MGLVRDKKHKPNYPGGQWPDKIATFELKPLRLVQYKEIKKWEKKLIRREREVPSRPIHMTLQVIGNNNYN